MLYNIDMHYITVTDCVRIMQSNLLILPVVTHALDVFIGFQVLLSSLSIYIPSMRDKMEYDKLDMIKLQE